MTLIARRTASPATFTTDLRGVAAIEFAILSPVFLLLFFGMIAYGIYLGASHSVQQIAADAARAAVAGLDSDERVTLATFFVETNAGNYPLIQPGELGIEVMDNPLDPSQFLVTLTYDASDLPIWQLISGLPLPSPIIVRQSTIRVGGL